MRRDKWRGSAISSEHMVQAAIRPARPVVVKIEGSGLTRHAGKGMSPVQAHHLDGPPAP